MPPSTSNAVPAVKLDASDVLSTIMKGYVLSDDPNLAKPQKKGLENRREVQSVPVIDLFIKFLANF